MVPNHGEEIIFTIANGGRTGFYFIWFCNEEHLAGKFRITFKPQESYVNSQSDCESKMVVMPLRSVHLKKLRIKLQVMYRPLYDV